MKITQYKRCWIIIDSPNLRGVSAVTVTRNDVLFLPRLGFEGYSNTDILKSIKKRITEKLSRLVFAEI